MVKPASATWDYAVHLTGVADTEDRLLIRARTGPVPMTSRQRVHYWAWFQRGRHAGRSPMHIVHACYSCDGVARGYHSILPLNATHRSASTPPSPIACDAARPHWALSAVLATAPAIGTVPRLRH